MAALDDDHDDRPSRDELLRFFLEHLVTDIKGKLPTWFQIHEGLVTGKNPYECERKITPRPPGAGMFLGSMEELRADVVKNGLGVIERGQKGFLGLYQRIRALRPRHNSACHGRPLHVLWASTRIPVPHKVETPIIREGAFS